jgi:hypothetical protein
MEQVLDILQKAKFRANLRKCYFGEAKIDYLGYEITRDGIQPQPKKVEALLKLSALWAEAPYPGRLCAAISNC